MEHAKNGRAYLQEAGEFVKKGESLVPNQWYQKICNSGNKELDHQIKDGTTFKNGILSSPVKVSNSHSIRKVKLTPLCTTDIELSFDGATQSKATEEEASYAKNFLHP